MGLPGLSPGEVPSFERTVKGAVENRDTLLVFSQVYIPDPASVGQHMADACAEMTRRGWRVIVYTADCGYDDPSVRYSSQEMIDGVEIHRIPLSSFGKASISLRLLAGWMFVIQCIIRGVWTRDLRAIFISTSPPMAAVAAIVVSILRGGIPIKYWVMDLNPDQMVAVGRVRQESLPVRLFDIMNRAILRRASDVVVLDRFMGARIEKKGVDLLHKMSVIPPWPHEGHLESIDHLTNPFREEHGLQGKFVIMYSGNHSHTNPVTTVLEAALRLQDDPDLVFMFIGGGVGKVEVKRIIEVHRPKNIYSLPYQPLDRIKYSLSAADVHLVSVGETVVGVVHPCKIYGAMSIARPILLLGPEPCHVSDLISKYEIGWHIRHGDVDDAVETIQSIRRIPTSTLTTMGYRASEVVRSELSETFLRGKFCDVLERDVARNED